MADRFNPMPVLGAAAVAVGLCCGLPVLLSAGVLTAVAGLGLGSWLILAIGAAIVIVALVRRRSKPVAATPLIDAQRSERSPSHVE